MQSIVHLEPHDSELLRSAWEAREQAYCPNSGFSVGAAVRCVGGRIYSGCNIENVSLGLTMCAERVAVFNAVAAGERSIITLALVASEKVATAVGGVVRPEGGITTPCGACRQVLMEFASDLRVIMAYQQETAYLVSLSELLPYPFTIVRGSRGA